MKPIKLMMLVIGVDLEHLNLKIEVFMDKYAFLQLSIVDHLNKYVEIFNLYASIQLSFDFS